MVNILITGGSDGLGKTLAYELSIDYNVIILAKNKNKLQKIADELGCKYYVCDVSKYKEVEQVIKDIGDIDILINNAGLCVQGELDDNDYELIQKVIDVNLLGLINCTKACLPVMKRNKKGLIININSQAGLYYASEREVYCASKWGVTAFSRSIELELKKYGIKVTDIMPGKMKTDIFKKGNIEKSMKDALDTKEVAKLVKFIINLPNDVNIPEVGIKNLYN